MKLKILFFVFLLVCSSCALDKRDIISSNFDFARYTVETCIRGNGFGL